MMFYIHGRQLIFVQVLIYRTQPGAMPGAESEGRPETTDIIYLHAALLIEPSR